MARRDWVKEQARFLAAHAETGIGPEEWCNREGINFSSAKRYIKIAGRKTANSQKKTVNKSANSQRKIAEKIAKNSSRKIINVNACTELSEEKECCFDPDEFGISEQQGIFAQHVAMGKKLIDSYRLAGYKSEGNAANAGASQLLRNIKVSRAIRWLRDRRQKRLALTESEIIHQLSSIASMDPNAISQIRRVNCRYCWGDGHQYQWRDVGEYERACAAAEADSKTPPSFEGGIGFVDTTIPNDECPRCSGEGRMETFYADTTQLEGPERWGYLGVEETMNGLKVKLASPEAARKELLAYLKATKGKLPAAGEQPEGGTTEDDYDREWKRLRNEKILAEIERIRTGDKESSLIVVHNALQVPGAVQPTQEDIDEGDE